MRDYIVALGSQIYIDGRNVEGAVSFDHIEGDLYQLISFSDPLISFSNEVNFEIKLNNGDSYCFLMRPLSIVPILPGPDSVVNFKLVLKMVTI